MVVSYSFNLMQSLALSPQQVVFIYIYMCVSVSHSIGPRVCCACVYVCITMQTTCGSTKIGTQVFFKSWSFLNFFSKKSWKCGLVNVLHSWKRNKLVHFEIFLPFVSLLHLKGVDLLSVICIIVFYMGFHHHYFL